MNFDFENISSEHLIIVLVGYVIVFIALAILWGLFYNLPVILTFNPKKLFQKENTEVAPTAEIASKKTGALTGEETAAISAALFLYVGGLHDEENTVLTIQKISRRYSPWSSKIYNVTNGLNKRF
jgi:hypothetical protein